jgi:hypothetical protein
MLVGDKIGRVGFAQFVHHVRHAVGVFDATKDAVKPHGGRLQVAAAVQRPTHTIVNKVSFSSLSHFGHVRRLTAADSATNARAVCVPKPGISVSTSKYTSAPLPL